MGAILRPFPLIPCASDDCGDSILAGAEIALNPLKAAPLGDQRQHLSCDPVGLRTVAGLLPGRALARPFCRQAGADPLAQRVRLKLRYAGEYRRYQPC